MSDRNRSGGQNYSDSLTALREADATLFLDGRVHFYLPSGERGKSGTAPSALLAYGQNNVEALRNAGIAGALYPKVEMLPGTKASQF